GGASVEILVAGHHAATVGYLLRQVVLRQLRYLACRQFERVEFEPGPLGGAGEEQQLLAVVAQAATTPPEPAATVAALLLDDPPVAQIQASHQVRRQPEPLAFVEPEETPAAPAVVHGQRDRADLTSRIRIEDRMALAAPSAHVLAEDQAAVGLAHAVD